MSDRRPRGARGGLRTGVLLAAALAALLVATTLASTSLASVASGTLSALWGRHHRQHQMDPERAREHAEFAVGWLLHSVDGTDEQESRVNEIVAALIDDVLAGAEEHRGTHRALIDEFSGAEVDRDALERIRGSELELIDALSVRVIGAIADVAEVLTPEQRLELIERSHRVRRFRH